ITVGILDAGTGNLGLLTGGSILDAQADTVGVDGNGFADPTGDARVGNLIGAELRLEAGGDIGEAGNPLDTTVDVVAAQSGGSLYLYETDPLTVGTVPPVTVTRVNLDSSTTLVSNAAALAGMEATAGVGKLETIVGTLTVADPVEAGSNLLLAAGGAGSDLTINAVVDSTGAGHLTLLAQNNVNQNAAVTTQGGTVFTRAVDGNITMASATTTTSTGGNIRFEAGTNMTLGILDAGAGNLSLLAGGDILDAQGDTVGVGTNGFADPTGDARVTNLNGAELRLEAGGDIGAAGNPLDIEVDVLSALAGGNLYLFETDALTVGTVTPVPVSRVNLDSTTTAIEEPTDLTGLEGTAGVVKLETIAGALGIDGPVEAGADILLAVGGAGSDLTINAQVTSTGAGHLTLLAQNNFIQNANATTQGGTL
ncbi:MAG: hypothetical protein WD645_02815, partial [Dehalococcoidia bacterium]